MTLLRRAAEARLRVGTRDGRGLRLLDLRRCERSSRQFNGARLARDPADVRVIRLRSGSYPLARRVGAELADCEFLGFLDDDDELIPTASERKIADFREHPEVDVLVTDGLRICESTEARIFPPLEERCEDFVETMMYTGRGACALTLRRQNLDLSAFDAEFRQRSGP